MPTALLLLALFGCRAAPPDEASPPDPPESEDLDSVGDRGHPIPFGVALSVSEPEALLLYPTLLAAAATPDQLLAALPTTAAGLTRMETTLGIQEDARSAWVGAMATYRGPGGKITLLVQDTGWEPAAVNRLAAAWKTSESTIADGRPVSSLPTEDRGGHFRQAPVDPSRPRIVLHAHANEGVDPALLVTALDDVNLAPLLPLLGEHAALERSPLLPANLSRLIGPATLADLIPAPDKPSELFAGHGWQREQRSDVVSVATRVFALDGAILHASLRDLGLPGHGVTVDAKGDLEGTADELRRQRSGLRCAPDVGACKAVEVLKDRYVWSVVGPNDRPTLQALFDALPRERLP